MWDFIVPNSLWKLKGACATTTHPELWFSNDFAEMQLAQRICWKCPVIAECLIEAYENNEVYGIWGGMTAKERKRTKRK